MSPTAVDAETLPEQLPVAQPHETPEASLATAQTTESPLRSLRPAPLRLATQSESSDDDDDGDGGTKPPIVLGPDGLPSLGSSGHATGDCKRCCFFPKGRCGSGHDCSFCHLDHEKRKRLKKKKFKDGGSQQQTPSSVAGLSSAGGLTPSMMPLGFAGPGGVWNLNQLLGLQPGTPVTPSLAGGSPACPGLVMPVSANMPPFAPPSLTGIRLADPPPPPSASSGAVLKKVGPTPYSAPPAPAAPAAPSIAPGLSPQMRLTTMTIAKDLKEATKKQPDASPGEVSAERVSTFAVPPSGFTLLDLLAAAEPDVDSTPLPSVPPGQVGLQRGKPESPRLAPAPWEPPLPLWPQTPLSVPSPHGAGELLHWPAGYAGAYPSSSQPELSIAALFPPASPAGFSAWSAAAPRSPAAAPPPVEGRRDSPRSVILTLSGAWGALTTPKNDLAGSSKKVRIDLAKAAFATEVPLADGGLARSELLAFRKACSGPRPRALKSLRVNRVTH